MLAPMARAGAPIRHQSAGGLVLKGVFLHPDHLAGFETAAFANPFASSPSTDEATLDRVSELSLQSPEPRAPSTSSPSSSIESSAGFDYFSCRPTSSSSGKSTPNSSAASTPTLESYNQKQPSLSRSNSVKHEVPLPSPAMLSFATFAAPVSRPSSRPSSPPRGAPCMRRPSSSCMQRAVSSPVETQRALDQRKRAMCVATDLVNEQAGRMVRSKSTAASFPGLGLGVPPPPPGRGSRQARSGTASPLVTPFEDGWGSALPPRAVEPQHAIPFPYNVASKPASPYRLARSHSVTSVPQSISSPTSPVLPSTYMHRNSLPNSHFFIPASSASLPASPVVGNRPRRGTLTPLTPIIPSSSLPLIEHDADLMSSSTDLPDLDAPLSVSPPVKPMLMRGMTF